MPDREFWSRVSRLTPERIKATRAELGLSQEGFAQLIGKLADFNGQVPSVFTVGRWERGLKQPGVLWGATVLQLVEESEARRGTVKTGTASRVG